MTPSTSHPELTEQKQVMVRQDESDASFEFDRIREIDQLDRQWLENELQRTQSAPEIPELDDDTPLDAAKLPSVYTLR